MQRRTGIAAMVGALALVSAASVGTWAYLESQDSGPEPVLTRAQQRAKRKAARREERRKARKEEEKRLTQTRLKNAREHGVDGGRWAEAPEFLETTDMLDALGYVDGSVEGESGQGVARHDPTRAYPGLNFYTSGHGGALLIDMNGRVLHTWSATLQQALDRQNAKSAQNKHWRRAMLLPNGDVIAIFEGKGIFRLDKDSNVLWATSNRAHHDLQLVDGALYTLKRRATLYPSMDLVRPVVEDFLVRMDPTTGEELAEWSMLQAWQNAPELQTTLRLGESHGDIFHTNTVEILDGSVADLHPAFQKGRLLTSFRNVHGIAVVDLDENRIVWAHRGRYRAQHDPGITRNQQLLVFDNNGISPMTRVLSFDLPAMTPRTVFRGTRQAPFASRTCGTVVQLPNDNLLVTESDRGRVLEVAPDGEVVWEYQNPARAGEEDQYIAAIFDMVRLPADYATSWLEVAP